MNLFLIDINFAFNHLAKTAMLLIFLFLIGFWLIPFKNIIQTHLDKKLKTEVDTLIASDFFNILEIPKYLGYNIKLQEKLLNRRKNKLQNGSFTNHSNQYLNDVYKLKNHFWQIGLRFCKEMCLKSHTIEDCESIVFMSIFNLRRKILNRIEKSLSDPHALVSKDEYFEIIMLFTELYNCFISPIFSKKGKEFNTMISIFDKKYFEKNFSKVYDIVKIKSEKHIDNDSCEIFEENNFIEIENLNIHFFEILENNLLELFIYHHNQINHD
ncbi:hypothetical protein EDEG_02190 [Edhazardia aedis USNM 41457]|uniref:Uncharacterized protein n=1 Tax=Edhazardia aedis (strain USNM 41457) TaxID=1003232 RepID=J9DLK4_EDHAE|nr:hypothetical protein EDEG_02190 [Edhazardia aedis USNM 41457]|eukprot:EJW03470.1 hypothetical protein EDEG_02190 [Edhazardia aedis USNM 41457]